MDQAFEAGAGKDAEVYTPWPSFEADTPIVASVHIDHPSKAALALAAEYHPNWLALKQGGRMLHARNCHQVLGHDLESPAAFVLCWTPDGSLDGRGPDSGGTGQALRIAAAHGVPVFNFALAEHRARVETLLEEE